MEKGMFAWLPNLIRYYFGTPYPSENAIDRLHQAVIDEQRAKEKKKQKRKKPKLDPTFEHEDF